jgi:hypothetical protein
VAEQLRLAVLAAYDRLFGLETEHLAVDGCITKAPCGGEVAGRSPVDRGKQGLKRSIVTESGGIPLGAVLLRPTAVMTVCWQRPWIPWPRSASCPPSRWCTWTPATTTRPAGRSWSSGRWSVRSPHEACRVPVQAGRRWPVERTHAWGNHYGKLRWCTERRRLVVEFWLALANAAIALGRLVRRAWVSYRWDARPRRQP